VSHHRFGSKTEETPSNRNVRSCHKQTLGEGINSAVKRMMDSVVTRVAHGMNQYDRDCPPPGSRMSNAYRRD
jgi:hypothetical protein